MTLSAFPVVNASLNGASAVILCVGYTFIRSGRVRAHAVTMIAALSSSAAFLACYLTYHYLRVRQGVGVTQFPAGRVKPYYLALLISHTILAVVILPMIGTTLWFAYSRQWPRHRRIAQPTFWLWLYVSVTGVVVYFMLYHVGARLAGHPL